MARKSKQISEEKENARKEQELAVQRLEEIERLETEAKKEEQENIEKMESKIKNICSDANLFCGMRMTRKDIVNLVDFAFANKDDIIEIPFHLYYID